MLLQDKVAVIYGAGGAIGGAVAHAFAREGATLFATGHRRAPVEVVAKRIVAAGGAAQAAADGHPLAGRLPAGAGGQGGPHPGPVGRAGPAGHPPDHGQPGRLAAKRNGRHATPTSWTPPRWRPRPGGCARQLTGCWPVRPCTTQPAVAGPPGSRTGALLLAQAGRSSVRIAALPVAWPSHVSQKSNPAV
jgi:hypothetical protein